MVLQASRILAQHPHPDRATIQRGLEGNLCRCTGYKKIIDAVEAAGREEAR
jgi:carbon-monoxide dehydrogenase small subunit